MTRQYGEKSDGLWSIPAAERNKDPILTVLRDWLPTRGLVLEIASGTGQHVVHFARALPDLTFQPTEPDEEFRGAIANRVKSTGLENVATPLDLDVTSQPWPVTHADAVLNINMIHVSPWTATLALIDGSAKALRDDGIFILYGPYRRDGIHTAPSNEAFDTRLRNQNTEWGVRDVEDVQRVAERADLSLDKIEEMPANNLMLLFRRRR